MNNAAINMHVHVFVQVPVFNYFVYISRSRIAGSYSNSVFNFFEEIPNCLPQWLHQFTFPPAMYECFSFSTSSPTLILFFKIIVILVELG